MSPRRRLFTSQLPCDTLTSTPVRNGPVCRGIEKKAAIFKSGYDRAYGARPLKRAIQRLVQDPLAMRILDGRILHGDKVKIDADKNGALDFVVQTR